MATFPIAPGGADYDGNWSPHIFALQLIIAFYASTCLSDIANTDYEGQISKQGSKVIINHTPELDVHDYTPGMELDYQNLDPSSTELVIDKAKYFAMNVDSVFKKQWNQAYDEKATQDGAMKLKIAIERGVFADIVGDAHPANMPNASTGLGGNITESYPLGGASGTALEVNNQNALDVLTGFGSCLDEQDVPRESGRFAILPVWMTRMLKISPLSNAAEMGDSQSTIRKGAIGNMDNFTIYQSNLLPYNVSAGAHNIIFGHKSALTFATQLVENDVLKNPKSFGTLMRSLNVYGFKVVKPESLGVAYLKPGTVSHVQTVVTT